MVNYKQINKQNIEIKSNIKKPNSMRTARIVITWIIANLYLGTLSYAFVLYIVMDS